MRRLLVLLFVAPFLAAGIAGAVVTFVGWRNASAIGRYQAPAFAARGRVRISGAVTRAAPVVSPLGQEGAGWVGEAGYLAKDRKGRISFEAVCVRGDLSDLRIGDGLSTWETTLVTPDDPAALGGGDTIESNLPIVDIGEPIAANPPWPVPDSFRRACGTLAGAKGPLSYRERVLASGTRVEMLGCGDGQRIARCGEGDPFLLTTSTIGQVTSAALRIYGFVAIFAGLWNLVIVLVTALTISDFLVRSKPTFREKVAVE